MENRTKTRINFRPITDEGLYTLYQSVESINFTFFYSPFISIENTHVQKRQSNWLKDMQEKLKLFTFLNKINPILMLKKYITDYKKEYRTAIKPAKILANDKIILRPKKPQKAMWTIIQNKNNSNNSIKNSSLNPDYFNKFFGFVVLLLLRMS